MAIQRTLTLVNTRWHNFTHSLWRSTTAICMIYCLLLVMWIWFSPPRLVHNAPKNVYAMFTECPKSIALIRGVYHKHWPQAYVYICTTNVRGTHQTQEELGNVENNIRWRIQGASHHIHKLASLRSLKINECGGVVHIIYRGSRSLGQQIHKKSIYDA